MSSKGARKADARVAKNGQGMMLNGNELRPYDPCRQVAAQEMGMKWPMIPRTHIRKSRSKRRK
jgi:hypothetical protein